MAAPARVQSVPPRRCTRCTSCGMCSTSTRQRCSPVGRARVRARAGARVRARVRARESEHAAELQHAPATRCSTGWNPMRPAVCDASAARLHDGVQPYASRLQPYAPLCTPMHPSCTQAAPWGHPVCLSGAARLLRGVQLVRPDYALASRAVPDHARATQIGSRESMAKSATPVGA